MTNELFRNDSYRQSANAKVISHAGDHQGQTAVVLDQTVFYIHGGGQPGDAGTLAWPEQTCRVINTRRDHDSGQVWHVLDKDQPAPAIGTEITLQLDWDLRYARMKMHTALHLLCSVIPLSVTGGQVGEAKSRLDFDTSSAIGENAFAMDKGVIEAKMNALIAANHPVSTRWVDDALLQQWPDIVRTENVRPPANADGLLRLVQIGTEQELIDVQPCGGTHVASTREIGRITVARIENKGARNRRVTLLLG